MSSFANNSLRSLSRGRLTWLRRLRDSLDRRQPLLPMPWGFVLAGNRAMAAGRFEQAETTLVRSLLSDVDTLVNIGANIGYCCCHALSLGKPVIAVEPMARNLHYLLVNLVANGWQEQAEVFPVALGSVASVLPIWCGIRVHPWSKAGPHCLLITSPRSLYFRLIASSVMRYKANVC